MSSFSFDRDNSLYKNRDALLEEYTPNNLVGRDDELEEFATQNREPRFRVK